MPGVVTWEKGRRSFASLCSLLPWCCDDGDGDSAVAVPGRRSSFSYHRLPEQRLRLSILKLDGSSFAVQIARTASMRDLKLAVEEVFSQSLEEGEVEISWDHVWGHFCLCYEGHKLIDDRASLRDLGIKDGDQLYFIRHLSINLTPIKRRHWNHGCDLENHNMSLSRPEVPDEEEINKGSKDDDDDTSDIHADEDCNVDDRNEDLVRNADEACNVNDRNDLMRPVEFKLAHFLRGWLSKVWYAGRIGSQRRFTSRPRSSFLRIESKNIEERSAQGHTTEDMAAKYFQKCV